MKDALPICLSIFHTGYVRLGGHGLLNFIGGKVEGLGDLKDDRARELEDFKKDPKKMVLLCTIGSGGVGLNIVEANHVFFVDPWFNPQTHAQAECRVHRIGQTKPVTVTYLIMDKTIDAWMFGSESCLLSSHSEPRWPRCIRVW